MFVAYAWVHDAWFNPSLIVVAGFIGIFMPRYSRLSNRIEQRLNHLLGLVTGGRLARFAAQLCFNLAVFAVFIAGEVIPDAGLGGIGGWVGVALITTLASQGAQYLGIFLFNRNIGDLNRNVLIALSVNVVVTALATTGLTAVQSLFLVLGLSLGAVVFGMGLLSDLRGFLRPKGGVGVFFGTFNPFHSSHLHIIETALRERRLEKSVIHPTIVPRLHARALERGEIEVAAIDNGMQVYAKTDKADVNVDYFPTGNRFFAPETRRVLMEAAILDAGLEDRVEVAYLPTIYDEAGFHGVLREIRGAYPGRRLHGLHGSDTGGMMVRAILDECGWIYPMVFLRRDNVSATAIRNGATGMTPQIVTQTLQKLASGATDVLIHHRRYRNDHGILLTQ